MRTFAIRLIVAVAALAVVVALPSAASAKKSRRCATAAAKKSKACKARRHGDSHPVAPPRHGNDGAETNDAPSHDGDGSSPALPSLPPAVAQALAACQAEQAANPDAFTAQYANADGAEALGNCVRSKLAAGGDASGDDDSTPPPPPPPPPTMTVQQAYAACLAEQAADPAAFLATYADQDGREAMGRCVHRKLGY